VYAVGFRVWVYTIGFKVPGWVYGLWFMVWGYSLGFKL